MANEGIMAAPMPMQKQQQQPPQGYVSSLDAYNAASSAMQETDPQAFGEYKTAIGSKLSQLNLKPSEIEAFITLLEYMMQYPDQYKEVIRAGIEEGAIDEGDFPAEFDQGFITNMLAALNEQRIQQAQNVAPEAMGPGPQEPMAMKSGGLADAAKALQAKGRNSDTMLAHINPQEAQMLRRAGGLGTINPYTGLPEYFSLKQAWKAVTAPARAVVNVAKDIAKSPIGKIALTIGLTMALGPAGLNLGLGMAGTGAVVGGGMAALGGGNLQDVLKGAAMGYIGGTVAPSISSYMPGAAGSVLNQGFTGAALGTGFGLATGMTPEQALKAGAIGGITAAGVGYGQQKGYLPGGAPRAAEAPTDAAADGSNLSLDPIESTGGVGTATENLTPVMRQDALSGQQFSVGMDGKEYLVYKDAAGNNQYVRADAVNTSQPMDPSLRQGAPVTPQRSLVTSPVPDVAPVSLEGLGQQTANTYYTGGGQSPEAISMQDASLGVEIGGPRYGGPAPVVDKSSYSLGARAEQVYSPVKDFYNENFSPSRPSMQQQDQGAILAGTKARTQYIQSTRADGLTPTAAGADAAYQAAYEANAPGFFSKYAPLAAAGLGATYLAGGFEKPPVDDTPVYDPYYTGTDYMRDNPQFFSGGLYDYRSRGDYDPYRETRYGGELGAATRGVVTPTGLTRAQYSPDYGRRRTQLMPRYYSPFIGTAEPVMAARGGMITTEPVYMGIGGSPMQQRYDPYRATTLCR
jgi:hypothetical protein